MKNNKGLYKLNKEAKTVEIIECPVCHRKFVKRQYSQAFCCTNCKDKFWIDTIRIDINMIFTIMILIHLWIMIGTKLLV